VVEEKTPVLKSWQQYTMEVDNYVGKTIGCRFYGSSAFLFFCLFFYACPEPGTGNGPERHWWELAMLGSDPYDAYNPEAAMDPDGNVTIVWEQGAAVGPHIAANFYQAGRTWAEKIRIEDVGVVASSPDRALNPDRGLNAVFMQSGHINGVVGHEAVPNSLDNSAQWASSPQIASDASGNALAVWQQSDGIRTSI